VNIKTSDGFIRIPVEKLKGKVKEAPKDTPERNNNLE
jgi:hypothetical protein